MIAMPEAGKLDDLGPEGPFALGTVQIGMPYGMGAARGGLDATTACDILDAAARCGVIWLDTAHAYGEAEARIGDWLARRGHDFRIATKLPALPPIEDGAVGSHVTAALEQSLSRLGVGRVDICLAHRASDFLRPPVAEALREMRGKGLLGRFGASVYTVEETERALAVEGVGAIQVPLNAVSSPIAEAGLVEEAEARGIAVFARSVFLQGTLLMPPERLPAHLAALAPVIERLRETARAHAVPLARLLMDTVAGIRGVYSLVIGTDSCEQVETLAGYARARPPRLALPEELRALTRELPSLVTDPRQWTQAGRQAIGG